MPLTSKVCFSTPLTPPSVTGYGYVLVNSGDPVGGLAEFKKVLQREPDNVHVQVNVGYAYIGAGNYKAAIEELSQVTRNHADDGGGPFRFGCCL